MRVVATIEARMRSTRLPGKVLKTIMGRPMLELMIERLRLIPRLDAIVIATTTDGSCDPIEALAGAVGVGCHRGSEEDVLERVLGATRGAGADLIVETTADCPLIDPETVTRAIDTFLASDVDYLANTTIPPRTYPAGMDVQVFPQRVLEEVAASTNDPADREHVSRYIYTHPERFRLLNLKSGLPEAVADLRLTVDTPADFALVTRIYETLYPANPRFSFQDMIALLEREPQLAAMNRPAQ